MVANFISKFRRYDIYRRFGIVSPEYELYVEEIMAVVIYRLCALGVRLAIWGCSAQHQSAKGR